MNSILFGIIGVGLIAVGANTQPSATPAPAPMELSISALDGATLEGEAAGAASATAIIAPPTDLENDDSGDYMKGMSPAQLEKLYAQHDAEVARLMAAAPDDELFGETALIDPETGEEISIDLVAF